MTRTNYPKKKNKTPGRLGIWHDSIPKRTYELTLLGLKDKELAIAFGVYESTINTWKRNHPEFREAIYKGKLMADGKVAKAMYQRAIGYSHPDTVILTNRVTEYNADGKAIRSFNEPLVVPIIKHYPPDAYSCNKWLSMRQRELWAEVAHGVLEHRYSGSIDIRQVGDIPLEELTREQQEFLFQINMKQLSDGIRNN